MRLQKRSWGFASGSPLPPTTQIQKTDPSCSFCFQMGGHSAWRKRVEAGELAKGRGGAILRHRPHFGRKGEDLKLNRKGNIAGGNPKKSSTKAKKQQAETNVVAGVNGSNSYWKLKQITIVAGMGVLSFSFVGFIFYVLQRAK